MNIVMFDMVGDFGEDKDMAARLREERLRPALALKDEIILDFDRVSLVTQSFIHALISDLLRKGGEQVLDHLEFKNGSPLVRGIVSTVVQYSLDTMQDEDGPLDEESS